MLLTIGGVFGGPIFAIFTMGIFLPFVRWKGAFTGFIIGVGKWTPHSFRVLTIKLSILNLLVDWITPPTIKVDNYHNLLFTLFSEPRAIYEEASIFYPIRHFFLPDIVYYALLISVFCSVCCFVWIWKSGQQSLRLQLSSHNRRV